LHENGIISGDKVAILSENQPNWAIVFFAVTSIGAVLIPIMTEFHSSQVQHIINHSEAKALFVSSRFSDKLEGLSIPASP
jgi:long-chain acyl-CoA synthetase